MLKDYWKNKIFNNMKRLLNGYGSPLNLGLKKKNHGHVQLQISSKSPTISPLKLQSLRLDLVWLWLICNVPEFFANLVREDGSWGRWINEKRTNVAETKGRTCQRHAFHWVDSVSLVAGEDGLVVPHRVVDGFCNMKENFEMKRVMIWGWNILYFLGWFNSNYYQIKFGILSFKQVTSPCQTTCQPILAP